jgi:hypothetical protein
MTRAVLAMTLVAGCTAPAAYLGVDLRTPAPAGVARAVQQNARAALAGDKHAMLALGQHFEDTGQFDRACMAYRAAGTTTGGTIYVYSPPVTQGGSGRVIPITTPASPGLASATEKRAVLAYRATAAEKAASACLRDAP